MKVYLEANTTLANVPGSYSNALKQIHDILLRNTRRIHGLTGVSLVSDSPTSEVTRLVQEKIQALQIEVPGYVFLTAPENILATIENLELAGHNPHLLVLLPWDLISRLHAVQNLGTYSSKFPYPEQPLNELGYFIG